MTEKKLDDVHEVAFKAKGPGYDVKLDAKVDTNRVLEVFDRLVTQLEQQQGVIHDDESSPT